MKIVVNCCYFRYYSLLPCFLCLPHSLAVLPLSTLFSVAHAVSTFLTHPQARSCMAVTSQMLGTDGPATLIWRCWSTSRYKEINLHLRTTRIPLSIVPLALSPRRSSRLISSVVIIIFMFPIPHSILSHRLLSYLFIPYPLSSLQLIATSSSNLTRSIRF